MNRRARFCCGTVLAAIVVTPALLAQPASLPQRQKATPAVDVQDFVFLAEARPVLVRVRVQVDGAPVRAGYDAFLKHLFAYLDMDGDGFLSPAEAERVPLLGQILSGTIVPGIAAFGGGGSKGVTLQELDTDKDGKVSPAELKAYYVRNGFTPIQSHFDAKQDNPFTMAMGSGQAPPTVAAVGEAVFALLDTNKDGKLSRAELAAAAAVLLRKDENEDDLITPAELVPPAAGEQNNYLSMMAGLADNKPADNPLVVLVDADRNAPDLAGRFLKRYGPKVVDKKPNAEPSSPLQPPPTSPKVKPNPEPSALPPIPPLPTGPKLDDKEGKVEVKLSRKELGLDEKTFALDKNGDGSLDAKELAGFVKRTPDMELVVRLGARDHDQQRLQVLANPGLRGDQVKVRDHLALFELGATRMEVRGGRAASRANVLGGILKGQFLAQFKQADKDHNGYLDAKEAAGSPIFAEVFKAMDRDGDGKVYEREFLAYLDKLEDLQKRAAAACVTLVVQDQSRGLFDLLDADRDGRLSVRELRGAPRLLDELGRAGKGFLTKADLPHSYLLTLRPGPAPQGGFDLTQAFDQIYGGSAEDEAGDYTAAGPLWFRKMDRNRDGDVSRKEFLGTDEQFREIDTDGDGLISVAEAERYDARLRRKP